MVDIPSCSTRFADFPSRVLYYAGFLGFNARIMKYMKIPTFRVIIIQVPALALSIEGLELMAIWAAFASGIQLHGELRQIVFLACI